MVVQRNTRANATYSTVKFKRKMLLGLDYNHYELKWSKVVLGHVYMHVCSLCEDELQRIEASNNCYWHGSIVLHAKH